ncbi:unnamed protein product [Chilo suppressalis]|uniref:Uncharacterized protein n=1 Tax=Chilo suppressalis TaxID=168631 RepID=A0ABN8BEN2_CHISP|nr:unnamed protein product [Chilo suppressalis]
MDPIDHSVRYRVRPRYLRNGRNFNIGFPARRCAFGACDAREDELQSLNEYFDQFGFIYDINYLKSIPKEDLLKHCNDLGTILREDENSDIQPFELYEELQLLKSNSLDSINDAKQLIHHILENNLEEHTHAKAVFCPLRFHCEISCFFPEKLNTLGRCLLRVDGCSGENCITRPAE